MADFEGKKSSNDIINKGTMSDDEGVASYVPPRYLFFQIAFLFFKESEVKNFFLLPR